MSLRPRPSDFATIARGFLMGAADIVPGVSGGTVALIVGIYDRLLTAISSFDAELARLISTRKWRSAAEHVDFRFLLALAIGIVGGFVSLAGVMHHLLEHHLSLTFAAFFGLILASGLLVGRMCRPDSTLAATRAIAVGVAAAAAAFWLVTQPQLASGSGLVYTFLCGSIAICAMILPGISGSYLLVLLGMYEPITGLVKRAPRLDVTGDEIVTLVVFIAGCATGLLTFSRLLKLLLARMWTPTMAALCGFMIGSLYKIWPFQRLDPSRLAVATDAADLKDRLAAMRPCLPEAFDGHTASCLGIALVAALSVLGADALARRAASGDAAESPSVND
ncbi:MAG: DUF368 domain-containing protein [Planctomycetota bacterium]